MSLSIGLIIIVKKDFHIVYPDRTSEQNKHRSILVSTRLLIEQQCRKQQKKKEHFGSSIHCFT